MTGRKRGPKGPTGPRKGSLAHWLSTFELGEVRFTQAKREGVPNWILHPPPSRTRHLHRFTCAPYCAVPLTDASADPVYLWRVERVE